MGRNGPPFRSMLKSNSKCYSTGRLVATTPSILLGGDHRESPIANYNYHSVAPEGFVANCGRTSHESLWYITRDYLKKEARHDFFGEAALLGVIVITAFLALIRNAQALTEFVRAIANC